MPSTGSVFFACRSVLPLWIARGLASKICGVGPLANCLCLLSRAALALLLILAVGAAEGMETRWQFRPLPNSSRKQGKRSGRSGPHKNKKPSAGDPCLGTNVAWMDAGVLFPECDRRLAMLCSESCYYGAVLVVPEHEQ